MMVRLSDLATGNELGIGSLVQPKFRSMDCIVPPGCGAKRLRLATTPCQPGTSCSRICRTQRYRLIFGKECSITQDFIDIGGLEIGVSSENRVARFPGGKETQQTRDREAHTADAWLPSANRRIGSNSGKDRRHQIDPSAHDFQPRRHSGAQARVAHTTFASGSPRSKCPMLSAIACWRRRTVPSVQPDMCGVNTQLSSSWKAKLPGCGVASPGPG